MLGRYGRPPGLSPKMNVKICACGHQKKDHLRHTTGPCISQGCNCKSFRLEFLDDKPLPKKWLKNTMLEKNWYRQYDGGVIMKNSTTFHLIRMLGSYKADIRKVRRFCLDRKTEFRPANLKRGGLFQMDKKRMWITPKAAVRMTALDMGINNQSLMVLSFHRKQVMEGLGFFLRSAQFFNEQCGLMWPEQNYINCFNLLYNRDHIIRKSLGRYITSNSIEVHADVLEKVWETILREPISDDELFASNMESKSNNFENLHKK